MKTYTLDEVMELTKRVLGALGITNAQVQVIKGEQDYFDPYVDINGMIEIHNVEVDERCEGFKTGKKVHEWMAQYVRHIHGTFNYKTGCGTPPDTLEHEIVCNPHILHVIQAGIKFMLENELGEIIQDIQMDVLEAEMEENQMENAGLKE